MGSLPPSSEPEFLSSDAADAPPAPPRRSKPGWAVTPATHALVALNCLVFLWMLAHHVNAFNPTAEQLLRYGANNITLVLYDGQWSRIVTAMFLHVGLIHLATNMWCLWNLGMLAEPLVGSGGLVAAYILSGAAGNLLSTFLNWFLYAAPHQPAGLILGPVGAGASGAVFGLAGVLIILLKSPRLPVPRVEVSKLRRSVIYFAIINFVIGVASYAPGVGVRIDNMAHLGGFCCGLVFAAPMVPRLGAERKQFLTRRRIAVVLVVGLLVLSGFFLAQLPG